MTQNEYLRANRMVFYERDVERIDSELDAFLELSKARSAMLIDLEGHLVTRRGETVRGSLESVAALAAGSFAATKEMARLLGEEHFSTLFHQGARDSIQLSLVGERALFAIVFDERTNLGLVRFYAQETHRRRDGRCKCARDRLERLLASIEAESAEREGESLADDYSSRATAALDEMF